MFSLAVSNLLEWPILIPPYAIVASTLFAMAIAVFFGFYPARKASQLNLNSGAAVRIEVI